MQTKRHYIISALNKCQNKDGVNLSECSLLHLVAVGVQAPRLTVLLDMDNIAHDNFYIRGGVNIKIQKYLKVSSCLAENYFCGL